MGLKQSTLSFLSAGLSEQSKKKKKFSNSLPSALGSCKGCQAIKKLFCFLTVLLPTEAVSSSELMVLVPMV